MVNKLFLVCLMVFNYCVGSAQDKLSGFRTFVTDREGRSVPGASVSLQRAEDSLLVKFAISDTTGEVKFTALPAGKYFMVVTMINYKSSPSPSFAVPITGAELPPIVLMPSAATLQEVTVSAKKPFVQLMADKTIVNVDAGITNAGATVLEVLEKSPGITVDKDGNISLKGKQNVLILIDGKPTYLPGSEVAQMLGGMSASQIDQFEIMDNPPAKYDAAGNGGVINITTKKIRQKGFNGNFSTSFGQGHYYKNNNSLTLNYRHNHLHLFLTYSSAFNKGFTDLYALRSYYKPGTKEEISRLTQDNWLTSALQNHTLKTGADITVSKRTTVGFVISGIAINRVGTGDARGTWSGSDGVRDSVVDTYSGSRNRFRNMGGNINMRHTFSKDKELTADIDYLHYQLQSRQLFDNVLRFPSAYTESVRGDLPAEIGIISGKIDYHQKLNEKLAMDGGLKSSLVKTDNLAAYDINESGTWKTDYDKTNHFIYNEKIYAAYLSADQQLGRFSVQGGLRFEHTQYEAEQKGNPFRKDSTFDRNYSGLFPTLFAQYKADSLHSFSLSAGRRIDRPPYQKLNPFVFVINKYTYQRGNPLFQPQYTWNMQVSHQFKDIFVTTLSYNITHNYFSQIFLTEPNGILIYTEGNLGRMRNVGLSVSARMDVTGWWSLSTQANLYNKKIEGVVWNARQTALTQFNMNLNNQFRLGRGWAAELSGFFVTREQELQEITEPTGQLIAGVAKQIMKNKGSIKLTLRDIFYTQAMKGDTDFEDAFEYFKLTRDTRVLTFAFTYRFGKSFKTNQRKTGASEEMERVGTGS